MLRLMIWPVTWAIELDIDDVIAQVGGRAQWWSRLTTLANWLVPGGIGATALEGQAYTA